MKNQKTKVLVVFEDGSESLEATAKGIRTTLGDNATVKVRAASEVAVAEVLAADAYAFGVDDADDLAWSELRRLLVGMNLAGRPAGFFSSTAGGADALKESFSDAELSVAPQDLIAGQANALTPWAGALLAAR
ncbi:MAG: hypothetical protein JXM71_06880 [Spirochaetales bacterium]|nr:hypothetical protein [Spirochaetales bacterium]